MKIELTWLRVCFIALMLATAGETLVTRGVIAQETDKQKGRIECWVRCCPWEIGCRWNSSSSARKADSGAEVRVTGGQLLAEFKPTGEEKVFEVDKETKLDAQTADALGYKEITLKPGKYAITRLENGKAKVAVRVKAIPKEGRDLKENKGNKSKN